MAIEDKLNDPAAFPADKVFDFDAWSKPENNKSILKEGEDTDPMGGKGNYMVNEKFNIVVLATYEDDDKCK